MERIKLYHGDCLEVMKHMEEKSVDMILTDIPYDEVNQRSNGLRSLDKDKADVKTFDLMEFLVLCNRVCRGSIYVFCGINQVSNIRKSFQKFGMSTRIIVWQKSNPSPMNGDKIWLSGIELCVYGKFPKATFNGHCRNTVLKYSVGRSKLHPTEKNLDLFTDLVKVSSNEGDTILDCCMGSGTTGVACVKTNRNFIGIELERKYFEIAEQRIENAKYGK